MFTRHQQIRLNQRQQWLNLRNTVLFQSFALSDAAITAGSNLGGVLGAKRCHSDLDGLGTTGSGLGGGGTIDGLGGLGTKGVGRGSTSCGEK